MAARITRRLDLEKDPLFAPAKPKGLGGRFRALVSRVIGALKYPWSTPKEGEASVPGNLGVKPTTIEAYLSMPEVAPFTARS